MAPGAEILAADTTRSQQYSLSNGTSDATAYVSATAALVRSKFPELSAGQVINRLIKSATFAHHKGLQAPDEEYGYGIARPYSALTMDIPAGPKRNPLGHLQSPNSTSGGASKGTDTSTQAEKESSSRSILVVAGGIAAAMIVGAIAFAVIRSRRNGGNGGPGSGGGTPVHGMGYPPQPPMGYQQYPNATPNQGYPTAPGQSPQYPNPYAQQPPYQG